MIDAMADAARRRFFKRQSVEHPFFPWKEVPPGTRTIWRRVARDMLIEMASLSDSEIIAIINQYRQKENIPKVMPANTEPSLKRLISTLEQRIAEPQHGVFYDGANRIRGMWVNWIRKCDAELAVTILKEYSSGKVQSECRTRSSATP